MQTGMKTEGFEIDEKALHECVAKATETLPDDVREVVVRAADEAGAMKGTILLLSILSHLRVGDDEDLSEKAREALKPDGA